ncbi:MAG TPA: hypothetical protein VE081_01525 [Sporichthyaceae bacterium]|nr:hypothetical protein [Sporichthyaceae bacterium]
MRTTRIASFLGAVTVAASTWVIAAPPAFAADPCVKDAKSAGLHKKAAKEACGSAASGDIDSCATAIAQKAKPPVKDDNDKAQEICKSAAPQDDQPDPMDQPKP